MEDTLNSKFHQIILRFHQLGGELPPLEKFNITPAQVVYLDYLAKHPGSRLSQLTEALNYKAASVSGMVSTLQVKGLVRKMTEPDDARALSLALTEEGQNAVGEINKFRNMRVAKILEKLNEEEKQTLLGLLEKALDAAEEKQND
jgi:DNA-binding MarR family transcriptional regulator